MEGAPDRDSDIGEDSPMSHHDAEVEGEMSDVEQEPEESSDEGRGTLQEREAIGLLRHHRSEKPRDDFNSLKNSMHPHLSSLATLAQNTPLGSLPQVGVNPLLGPPSAPFSLPMGFSFPHPGSFLVPTQPASGPPGNMNGSMNGTQGGTQGSASSSSSEGSTSSQQTWSFEEQFKQVRQDARSRRKRQPELDRRMWSQAQNPNMIESNVTVSSQQLYEINDDPKRKEFLDELFSFMQKRGTPINRLPIMAKSVLDLFELYNLVIARGGLVDVINKKLWQEIIKGLHLPSSITSAAFTLRTQYMKYLYPYECDKKNLSTPSELQAAIDGNRREGRRSSYGQFDQQVQQQLNMPAHSSAGSVLHQVAPLSLVTGGARVLGGGMVGGGLPGLGAPGLNLHHPGQHGGHIAHELEQRVIDYMKMLHHRFSDDPAPTVAQLFSNPASPPEGMSPREAAINNALEMSRLSLWNSIYNNNHSPPTNNASPPSNPEPQREALNLSESPNSNICVKRELIERDPLPPAKRVPPQPAAHSPSPPPAPKQRHKPVPASPNSNHTEEHTIQVQTSSWKMTTKGNTDQKQLSVSLEINGVTFEGVLMATTQPNSNGSSRSNRSMVL